ncbi:MAG: cytochrome c oxidase subunit II [Gemmatimonadota bacterium]
MVSRAAGVRRVMRVAPLLLVVAVLLASCGGNYPQSTLQPKADFARMIDGVFMNTVYWAAGVFVLVEGALVWAIVRYRGKPNDPEPAQTHGNTTLEILWTAIPALILAMIAVPTVRAIFRTYEQPRGKDVLVVEVTGHQWWWEFRYPEYGVVTANELHVPVGRTVALKMRAFDVLHSFWMPQFAAKRDVFPNRTNTLWFRADSTGFYPGQCAEFCGVQHGKMAFHVVSQTQGEFDAYVSGLKATAPVPAAPVAPAATDTSRRASSGGPVRTASLAAQTPAAATQTAPPAAGNDTLAGAKLFAAKGCVGCHALNAMSTSKGLIGPNLANVGSRRYIAAGTLLNTDENLARWIHNPQAVKVGVLMPNLHLSEQDARTLAQYLRTHK